MCMGFRENLKEALDFRGLQQKELAHKSNISLRSIESYLRTNGSIPSAEKAVQIAQILGVTVEFLITGKNEPTDAVPSIDPEIRKLINHIKRLPKSNQQIVIQNAIGLAGILSQQK